MRKIGSHARGVDDIVESELVNQGAGFEEKRKGLDRRTWLDIITRERKGNRIYTWPMPPEAPRTAITRSARTGQNARVGSTYLLSP